MIWNVLAWFSVPLHVNLMSWSWRAPSPTRWLLLSAECTTKCLSLVGSSPWAVALTVVDTITTLTQSFVAAIALYQSISMFQAALQPPKDCSTACCNYKRRWRPTRRSCWSFASKSTRLAAMISTLYNLSPIAHIVSTSSRWGSSDCCSVWSDLNPHSIYWTTHSHPLLLLHSDIY